LLYILDTKDGIFTIISRKSIMRMFFVVVAISNTLFAQQTGARYLIITHDDYYEAMLPLAEWKTQKGLRTKIAKLSEIGSDSVQIKSYVTNAYNTWQIRPEYLLLVGNDDQIPFPRRPGIIFCETDNYYTDITGDFRNEIIPGRIWLYDTLEAQTIVAKVLSYDKEPFMDDSTWFRKGMTIINLDWDTLPGDPNYWASTRYAHSLMMNAGFLHIDSLVDVYGHDSTHFLNAFNDGRSYITYRGEAFGYWMTPFQSMRPEQMTNGFELPIVISPTCNTIDGIGHWWLRAGTPENAKGTVGFLGNTTTLSGVSAWRSALMKGSLRSIFRDSLCTLGKAAEEGRIEYHNRFQDSLEYDSWICLGDPEMTVRTGTPRSLVVTHPNVLWTGICTLAVHVSHNSVPVESALVCVMARQDTTFYQFGRTNNSGTLELIDTLNIAADSVFFTVTGRNLMPYSSFVRVNNMGSPYVILQSFSISDSMGGNGDSLANPGEDIEVPVWLRNWGDTTAYNVSAVIRKAQPDAYFTLSDTIKYFGNISALDSAFTSEDGYNITIAPNCPDTHQIDLQLAIRDAQNATWTSNLHLTVYAPVISLENSYFPSYLKYITPGDTNPLVIELSNFGSYSAENTVGMISSDDSFFVNIDSFSTFGSILPDSINSNQSNPFVIAADPQAPPCYPMGISLIVTSGVYIDTFDFTMYVGQKDFLVWDPDPNHSSGPIIKAQLDSLSFYGDYAVTFPVGLASIYKSLFICCGIYPDKCVIKDTSRAGQEVAFYLTSQNGRAYLEGGDVWVSDPLSSQGYDFCPLFNITPVSPGIGPFPAVIGSPGTFTESMLFSYQGEAILIDHIDSIGGSAVIFRNTQNDRGCGVAANHKTVGFSFEFGGLVDTILPSTKLILVDSIMQFFDILPAGIRENQQSKVRDVPKLTIYPNPSRAEIHIRYGLTQYTAENAILSVYDVTGRLVKQFGHLSGGKLPFHQVVWDATDQQARKLPTGVYFVELKIDNYTDTKKVILLE
jgi:hypothetical protein